MNNITGRLENWEWDRQIKVIWGNLYDDVHQRWKEGQIIHTSEVKSHNIGGCGEGDIITTRNSTYLLGKPRV